MSTLIADAYLALDDFVGVTDLFVTLHTRLDFA